MRKIHLRPSLIFLLLLLIFLVGLTTLVISISEFRASKATQHVFTADAENIQYPGLDLKHLNSHEFQKYVEALIAKKLRLRNFFIHVNNQIYYSLFKKSFIENSGIIVGKNKQLFQNLYINAYCRPHPLSEEQLLTFANQLKKLKDFFTARKITFIYLITPQKAEYLPEAIPDRFHCQASGLNLNLLRLEKLLAARGILYVNGPELMQASTKQYGISMFPQGGTHWNWLGAALGTNALIQLIDQERHTRLAPLHFQYTVGTLDHKDMDGDLIDLINLMKPDLSYPVPKIRLLNPPAVLPSITATFIGGSFNESPIKILLENKLFSKVNFYYYFRTERTFIEGKKDPVDRKLEPFSPSVLKAILASDVVILEENSALIALSEQGKILYKVMSESAQKLNSRHHA